MHARMLRTQHINCNQQPLEVSPSGYLCTILVLTFTKTHEPLCWVGLCSNVRQFPFFLFYFIPCCQDLIDVFTATFPHSLPPFTTADSCAAPSNIHYQHILWRQISDRSPCLELWQLSQMWTFDRARKWEWQKYIVIIKRRRRKGISNHCTLMPSRKPLGHRVRRKYVLAENCHISSWGYAQNDWLL